MKEGGGNMVLSTSPASAKSKSGKKKKGKALPSSGGDQEGQSQAWLVSFTDVMALMLTFFVLLFSMSDPDKDAWDGMTTALKTEFYTEYGARFRAGSEKSFSLKHIGSNEALDLGYVEKIILSDIDENEALRKVWFTLQKDRLILSVPVDFLFAGDDDTLSDEGRETLYAVAGILRRIRNRIEIQGHVIPRISSAGERYQRQWEASMQKAATVAAVFEAVGYRRNITISGYSSALYDSLDQATDAQERREVADRVDIIIMSDDGEKRTFTPDLIFQ